MNIDFNKFIEYFFDKYHLEPSFLMFGAITSLFIFINFNKKLYFNIGIDFF